MVVRFVVRGRGPQEGQTVLAAIQAPRYFVDAVTCLDDYYSKTCFVTQSRSKDDKSS